MSSIYRTDKKYRWGALAILIIGVLFIWSEPSIWYWVVGFWAFVVLLAYLMRNNP
jgi:hypothetical protein